MTTNLLPLSAELPLFWQTRPDYTLFYAPGSVVVVANKQAIPFTADLLQTEPTIPLAHGLRQAAIQATAQWTAVTQQPFTPLCLTLYLHQACHLACVYCFTDPPTHPAARLTPEQIAPAAHLVMQHCQEAGRPFTLVCHGGGEPTLYWRDLARILDQLNDLAAEYGLDSFRYIATNGVLSVAGARWLAEQFDLVGVSCDGPPAIQNAQRPTRNGRHTAPIVTRTAAILHALGTPLHVRVTLTRHSMTQQVEIATYLCRELRPAAIHVEPVYRGGRAQPEAIPTAASEFVAEFWRARAIARSFGIPWHMSGSRLAEVHGPYCHLFRQVLQLTPEGMATPCFKTVTAVQAQQQGMIMGEVTAGNGRFTLNDAAIPLWRNRLATPFPNCTTCFNRYHCTKGCPDSCPLTHATAAEFRCQVNQAIALAEIEETAATLWLMAHPNGGLAGSRVQE